MFQASPPVKHGTLGSRGIQDTAQKNPHCHKVFALVFWNWKRGLEIGSLGISFVRKCGVLFAFLFPYCLFNHVSCLWCTNKQKKELWLKSCSTMNCFRNYIWLRHVCIVAEPWLCGLNIPLYNYMEEVCYGSKGTIVTFCDDKYSHSTLPLQHHYYYPLAHQSTLE